MIIRTPNKNIAAMVMARLIERGAGFQVHTLEIMQSGPVISTGDDVWDFLVEVTKDTACYLEIGQMPPRDQITWEEFTDRAKATIGEWVDWDEGVMVELFDTGSVTVKFDEKSYVLNVSVTEER